MVLLGYSGARGTLIYEKNLKPKISCQTPFKTTAKKRGPLSRNPSPLSTSPPLIFTKYSTNILFLSFKALKLSRLYLSHQCYFFLFFLNLYIFIIYFVLYILTQDLCTSKHAYLMFLLFSISETHLCPMFESSLGYLPSICF